jgi:hypothetical protein
LTKFFGLTSYLGEAALQEALFRFLPRENKRRPVADFGLLKATQAA